MALGLIPKDLRQKCLHLLLRPLANFCVRHGFPIQEFLEAAKQNFVQAAQDEISRSGKKTNVSRIGILTGLHRNEVKRIQAGQSKNAEQEAGVIERVLATWEQDPSFKAPDGSPRRLSYKGKENEFVELVRRVSTHVTPGTVLFELERTRAIEKTPEGLNLRRATYRVGDNPMRRVEYLSEDIDLLINAVEENAFDPQSVSNLHMTTEYDNIIHSEIPRIRRWLVKEAREFHRRMREFLSRYDKDIQIQRSDEKGGAKVAIGTFSFSTKAIDQDYGKSADFRD